MRTSRCLSLEDGGLGGACQVVGEHLRPEDFETKLRSTLDSVALWYSPADGGPVLITCVEGDQDGPVVLDVAKFPLTARCWTDGPGTQTVVDQLQALEIGHACRTPHLNRLILANEQEAILRDAGGLPRELPTLLSIEALHSSWRRDAGEAAAFLGALFRLQDAHRRVCKERGLERAVVAASRSAAMRAAVGNTGFPIDDHQLHGALQADPAGGLEHVQAGLDRATRRAHPTITPGHVDGEVIVVGGPADLHPRHHGLVCPAPEGVLLGVMAVNPGIGVLAALTESGRLEELVMDPEATGQALAPVVLGSTGNRLSRSEMQVLAGCAEEALLGAPIGTIQDVALEGDVSLSWESADVLYRWVQNRFEDAVEWLRLRGRLDIHPTRTVMPSGRSAKVDRAKWRGLRPHQRRRDLLELFAADVFDLTLAGLHGRWPAFLTEANVLYAEGGELLFEHAEDPSGELPRRLIAAVEEAYEDALPGLPLRLRAWSLDRWELEGPNGPKTPSFGW